MTEQTIEAPRIAEPGHPPRDEHAPAQGSRVSEQIRLTVRRYPWALAVLGLLALATIVVLYARTRPGYDPWGWLVWGHLTIHGALDTNGAPSWKPMPFLVDVPLALFGHYSVWLWMIFSVAVSLSGVVFAWRIAFRLVERMTTPDRRYAAYVAGLFAAGSLLAITEYSHYILSSQSDTMIVSMCLGAIDMQMTGRYKWAFFMWWWSALGRPEVFPFLGLFAIWTWRERPELRRLLYAGCALVPILWFGIPALTAKSAFIAGDNALHSPRELHGNKITGTINRFIDLQTVWIWLAACLALAIAAIRRNLVVLLIGAGAALWVVVEIAFALHGWPAVPRYLFEAAGAAGVLAGIAVGMVVVELPALLRRLDPRLVTGQVAGIATAAVVIVFAGVLVPVARSRYKVERADLTHERARTREIGRLSVVVHRLGGGARILRCGQPNMPIGYQSVLAFYMGVKIGALYFSPAYNRLHPHAHIDFYPLGNGWKVVPRGIRTARDRHDCAHLTLVYRTG